MEGWTRGRAEPLCCAGQWTVEAGCGSPSFPQQGHRAVPVWILCVPFSLQVIFLLYRNDCLLSMSVCLEELQGKLEIRSPNNLLFKQDIFENESRH